jgi:putative SOS response-associated peptidase YedK
MCGRFTRYHTWAEIHAMYRLLDSERGRNTEARYNIAPTQDVIFVTAGENGYQKVREGRWWLVPHWAKEVPKYTMFNAKSEEAATKPSFRDSFRSKRCLIPADGFYEWTVGEDGGKDPWHIYQPGHEPFSFAGLWAYNPGLDITSCTILTAPAGATMAQLHSRQPVILDPAFYDAWLDPATPQDLLPGALAHNLDDALQFHRVNRDVNVTRGGGDHPGMIGPLNPA